MGPRARAISGRHTSEKCQIFVLKVIRVIIRRFYVVYFADPKNTHVIRKDIRRCTVTNGIGRVARKICK